MRVLQKIPLFSILPILALLLNALVWGISWWPFRQLEARGLHPLWTTVVIYVFSTSCLMLSKPHALGQLLHAPGLWVLMLAFGMTNAAFNWGVVVGDVVRVVFLFYLMPLWVALLARFILGESFTLLILLRLLLALLGAAFVLWPESGAPKTGWYLHFSDVLGLLGGFAFALTNVMLRHQAQRSEESRALAMFMGGMSVAGVLACTLSLRGVIDGPPSLAWGWSSAIFCLAVLFMSSNLLLQYGAARLPANVTSIVMLIEVVFAAVSAILFGAGVLTTKLMIGGALILLAAILSVSSKKVGDEESCPTLS